nr:helix-turn-helix domain-containing protein [Clostridium paraputrificum]
MEDLLEGKKSIEQIAADCGMPNSKAYTKAFKELYGIVPSHYRKKFINNMKINDDKKEQLMSLDNNQKQLLQPLLEGIENTIYEDAGVKIKVEEKHIICSIQCDKYVNSTISHCNDEIVIDIASV